MKIITILLAVALFSCHSKQASQTDKANALIDSLNKARYNDSVSIDSKMRLDEAKAGLRKGDTLSDSERLKKAREAFK